MKKIFTFFLLAAVGCSASAQIDTITNAGFERWGNPSPGLSTEPTSWYSDLSGSDLAASSGTQTCFQNSSAPAPHSGSYCVKVETESYLGFEDINGVVTTGIVNAPSITKTDGYIGTINYSNSSDIRRMRFTGRPDSLVGWYQYTPHNGTERGKVRAILHIGNYFDPEVSSGSYHPDPTDSQVASALFLTDTPGTAVAVWTRFSVPFTYTTGLYASDSAPDYIMINVTSSANQNTDVAGSILYLDDLGVIYNPTVCTTVSGLSASSITETTASISWTAVSGSVGYVYTVTTSATPPAAGAGTFTTATSVPLTGLTAGTSYYAYVYDSCGAGSSSGWSSYPFSTTSASGCAAVTGLAAGSITSSSATISWTAVSGSAGYIYAVDMNATPTTGTFTTATSVPVSGLTASTAYYAHVYDSCGAGSESAWVTVPFSTTSTGINNISNGNFSIKAFPNPVEDELTLNITGATGNTGRVELMDISGRVMNTAVATTSAITMSMNGLAPGIYFIRYTDVAHTQIIKISKQ